jgi:hypothetical protein
MVDSSYDADGALQDALPRAWRALGRAFALTVLTLRDDRISDVVAFIARDTDNEDPEAYVRWPDEPLVRREFHGGAGTFRVAPSAQEASRSCSMPSWAWLSSGALK